MFSQQLYLDMNGIYNYYYQDQLWTMYNVKYRPVGSTTYTVGSVPTGGGYNYAFRLNPFIDWEFNINNGYLNPSTNYNYSSINKSVGYSYNFDTSNIAEGWRGYRTNQTTNPFYGQIVEVAGVGVAGSKGLYFNWNNYGDIYLVSPKLIDLSTDKKITFKVRNTLNSNQNVPLQIGTIGDPYNPATFHNLTTVPVSYSNFYTITVNLNNYNGIDKYIAVRGNATAGFNQDVYIDDFSYEQSVNCFDNTNLNVSNITENTAVINFNADAAQNNWELSVNNITRYTTTVTSINSNVNYLLENLIGNTSYEIKVRALCAPGLYSNWTTVQNFTTPCSTISSGYQTSFLETSYINPCWKTFVNNANIYQGPAIMPIIVNPRTGTRMIEMTSIPDNPNRKSYLITPYVQDLDNNKRIKFYLVGRGQYINNSLTIGTMLDPADSNTFIPLKTIAPEEMNEVGGFNVNSYWKEHIIYLDNYVNTNNHHYIALKQNFEDNGTFYIDDFTYENIPVCKEPTNLTTIETDYNSAKLTWENYQNSSSEWKIEYGPTGFVPGLGTIATITSNPYTINSNLQDYTEYDFYVRSKCGSLYSNWSDRGYFKTKCIGVNVGYSNNFENDNFNNDNTCWRRLVPQVRDTYYAPDSFLKVTNISNYNIPSHSGNKFIVHRVTNVASVTNEHEKTILVSPRLINFNNYKKISFWVYFRNTGQPGDKKIQIGTLSNPNDYLTFTNFKTITISQNFDQWKQITVDFPDYRGTDSYIGIRQDLSNNYDYFFIDDFQYLENNCPKVTSLKAFQINNNTATILWQDNNTSFITQSWDIEYGIKGFTPGTGTIVNATTNPFNLTGLISNKVYEYRIKTNCGINNLSTWSDSYAFRIACVNTAPFSDNFDQYNIYAPNFLQTFCWTTNSTTILDNPADGGTEIPGNEINSTLADISVVYPNSFGPERYSEYLITPFLSDFSSNKRIKFWASLSDVDYTQENQQTIDLIIGTIKNPLDISTFTAFKTITLRKRDFLGKEFIVDFSSYTGNDKHIIFIYGNTPLNAHIYLDKFEYDNIQNCIEPLNLNVNNINSNQALISWDNIMTNPNLILEYGTEGFQKGTGNIISLNSINEKLITGLQENTNYDYYLNTLCTNESSFVIGPKKFKTTCNSFLLPWIEKFDNISEYGMNKMPSCMYSDGIWESKNQIITSNNSNEGTFEGVDDSYYAATLGGTTSNMFTPSFNLSAGTTYTLSFYQQKKYQYGYGGVAQVNAGLGNKLVFMKNRLSVFSGLLTTVMGQFKYLFTPLISGDYSFLLASWNSGQYQTAIDNLELKEGYTNVINQNIFTTNYNFQSPNSDILLEASQNTTCAVTADPTNNSNNYIAMNGADDLAPTWILSNTNERNINNTNVWLDNQNYVSKINFKVNTISATTSLFMSFDLKQTFAQSYLESRFRVLVNGIQIGTTYFPQTSNSDLFSKIEFDLTPYIGQQINISLQHIGKSNYGIGDNAFVDNLKFTNSSLLSNKENTFVDFKYFPNPTNDMVYIENKESIDKIELCTITGQVLLVQKVDSNKTDLNLNSFSSGIYFVKVFSNGKNKTFKIIKN